MAKPPQPFNNPFAQLKALQKKEPPEKEKAPPSAVSLPAPKRTRSTDEEEAALFLEAVGAVEKVRAPAERVPPPPLSAAELALPTEEAESLARLAELVSGEGSFDLTDSEERVEGRAHGVDERVMRKLRAGEFSSQASLDLHGLTREEAAVALEKFIQRSRVAGLRCVLVVTGRGLHSPDQLPVLKTSVQTWLTRGRSSRQVLAFSSARPKDGGTGAVYVLLRR